MNRSAIWLLVAACNEAPLVWPDDSYGPDGRAPWAYPTDVGCSNLDDSPDDVVIDGFEYCGVQSAFSNIVPVDDPIYESCASTAAGSTERVMAVFDGARARAYLLDAMPQREIVHTEWDGQDLLVAYCPIIAGGEVFHREIDGTSERFSVSGLWGSANTFAPRDERAAGAWTVYSTWDGRALVGPGRPGSVRAFGALIDYPTLGEFVDRHGGLGERCELWTGEEELGVGCDEACRASVSECGGALDVCLDLCSGKPRVFAECLLTVPTCEGRAGC